MLKHSFYAIINKENIINNVTFYDLNGGGDIMFVRALRGAITSENNTAEDIGKNTIALLEELISQNSIKKEDIVCIIFTLTDDLDAQFPAVAARKIGLTDVPLLCMKELNIKDGLSKCIRIMIQFNTEKSNMDLQHVFMKDAKILRPDLAK